MTDLSPTAAPVLPARGVPALTLLAEGFRAVIRKPYRFEELVSAVADAARSNRETTDGHGR